MRSLCGVGLGTPGSVVFAAAPQEGCDRLQPVGDGWLIRRDVACRPIRRPDGRGYLTAAGASL
jgi:hypothetical protein